MSSALLRQALAFVDPEENKVKGKKRRVDTNQQRSIGQASGASNSKKIKKQSKIKSVKPVETSTEDITEENIKKLLALSSPTTDRAVVEKIVKRAVKGKPLTEKIEIKIAKEKSILFPEDN